MSGGTQQASHTLLFLLSQTSLHSFYVPGKQQLHFQLKPISTYVNMLEMSCTGCYVSILHLNREHTTLFACCI